LGIFSEAEEANLEQPCGDVADASSAKSTATMKVAPTAAMSASLAALIGETVTTALIAEISPKVKGAAHNGSDRGGYCRSHYRRSQSFSDSSISSGCSISRTIGSGSQIVRSRRSRPGAAMW
jgi:hypothetical protein